MSMINNVSNSYEKIASLIIYVGNKDQAGFVQLILGHTGFGLTKSTFTEIAGLILSSAMLKTSEKLY